MQELLWFLLSFSLNLKLLQKTVYLKTKQQQLMTTITYEVNYFRPRSELSTQLGLCFSGNAVGGGALCSPRLKAFQGARGLSAHPSPAPLAGLREKMPGKPALVIALSSTQLKTWRGHFSSLWLCCKVVLNRCY